MPRFGEGDHGKATQFGAPGGNQRKPGRGRPSLLDDPEQQLKVAEAFTSGMTMEDIAAEFDVALSTARRWRRDPRIKAHCLKMTEDRILVITRKIDSQIESRLRDAGQMTVKELLEIRKEFLGGAFRAATEGADDETVTQAMALLEKNPQLAQQMVALLSGQAEVTSTADEADDEIPVTT